MAATLVVFGGLRYLIGFFTRPHYIGCGPRSAGLPNGPGLRCISEAQAVLPNDRPLLCPRLPHSCQSQMSGCRVRSRRSRSRQRRAEVGYCVVAALQDPRKEVLNIRNLFPDKIALRLDEAAQVDMVPRRRRAGPRRGSTSTPPESGTRQSRRHGQAAQAGTAQEGWRGSGTQRARGRQQAS
jgi:hypothetical protein